MSNYPTAKIGFAAVSLLLILFYYALVPPTPEVTQNFSGFSGEAPTAPTDALGWVSAAGTQFGFVINFIAHPDVMTAGAALPLMLALLVGGILLIIIALGIVDIAHSMI
jgi:hypothetical protein